MRPGTLMQPPHHQFRMILRILFLTIVFQLSPGQALAQLTGTFTIGAGGTYATITEAVSALNTLGGYWRGYF